MADLTGMMQAAAGSAGGPAGGYIGVAMQTGVRFTLLDNTDQASLTLAATYNTGNQTYGVSFSPVGDYGDYIAVSGFFGVVLLDHTTPGSISLAATYALSSYNCSFSPDGNYIAVAGGAFSGTTVALLNHTTPGSLSLAATYTTTGFPRFVDFSRTGDYVGVGTASAPYFVLLDHTTAGSLSLLATYTTAGNLVRGIAFSPDDNYIGAANQKISGNVLWTLLNNTSPGSLTRSTTYLDTTPDLEANGIDCDFSPDGGYVAINVTDRFGQGRLRLCSRPTASSISLVATVNGSVNATVEFNKTGDYVVTANTSTGVLLYDHTTPGSLTLAASYSAGSTVLAVSFSPFPVA